MASTEIQIDELVKKASKNKTKDLVIRYAYAHTKDKWWHLRKVRFKLPPSNMVLLFVCGCIRTHKPIQTHEHPTIGDVACDGVGNVEILTVEWA